MKPLPTHITGFYLAHLGRPPLPDTWAPFRRAGQALALSLGGQVVQAWRCGDHPERVHVSFHELVITAPRLGRFSVVCNRCHPYVAAARNVPWGYGAPWDTILDLPELRDAWMAESEGTNFAVLGPDDFFTPLTPELAAELSEADRSNLPKKVSLCVGDVVFNQWD